MAELSHPPVEFTDLHGGTISRRALARQLDHTLTAIGQTPPTSNQDLHDQLEASGPNCRAMPRPFTSE